jgi:DNA-binding NarL/FixJ family response regulator
VEPFFRVVEMSQVQERGPLKVRLIGYASATTVVLVGCVGLAGWVFNIAALRTIVPVMAYMPGMDGFEATIAIREKEKSTGVHQPVIAMTALAMMAIVTSLLSQRVLPIK